jgi:hypothetical protein
MTIHKRPRPPVRAKRPTGPAPRERTLYRAPAAVIARRPAERDPLRSGLRRPPMAALTVVTPKRPPPTPRDRSPRSPRKQ